MRIFSSAEYCLRVARRMSLVALAAPVWRVCNFCLIFVLFGHFDEPETLPYEIRLVCSIGADVKQQDELIQFCKGEIAHFKIPRYFRFVQELPMTITGKPQKFIMRDKMIEALNTKIPND